MSESTDTLVSNGGDIAVEENAPRRNVIASDLLLDINEGFRKSKADQILRLLRDQEDLNHKLYDCDIKNDNSDSEEDSDTLSDSSVKETEKRLALRLSLHKQVGGRSKTSMGFYNDVEKLKSSSDEEEFIMTDRPVNTRVNRPKSSYVRRRTDINGDSTDENMDGDFSTVQRRCRSSRPKSRCGNREELQNKTVLRESAYNCQAPPVSPNNDIVDSSQYDRYAHVRTPAPGQHPGLQRQRSRAKGFCDETVPPPQSNLQRQRTVQDISTAQTDETRDEFVCSSRQRHRRQQFRHARANRPGSENVYVVRQRNESNMLKTRTNNVRPKSDKTMIQQTKQNKMISIDTNPLQAGQNTGYQQISSNMQTPQQHPQQIYPQYTSGKQRPVSRRSHGRQDIAMNPRGTGVISGRPQPIGVMKLPPLDPTVAKRAERIVLAARETCA